jgi:diguanylate cyclase (GGDEF)-like protein
MGTAGTSRYREVDHWPLDDRFPVRHGFVVMRSLAISPRNRTLAVLVAVATSAIVLVAACYVLTETERIDIQTDSDKASELRGLAADLGQTLSDQESNVDDYMLFVSPTPLARYQTAIAAEATLAQELTAAATESPEVQASVRGVTAAAADWRAVFGDPATAAARAGDAAELDAFTQSTADDADGMDRAVDALGASIDGVETELRTRAAVLADTRTEVTGFGLAGLASAAGFAIWMVRRYGRALEATALHSGVLNRFTEVTSFAPDDTAVAASNLEALALLVHPDAAVTHVLNRSLDRATPDAILGGAIAEVLPMHGLAKCVGVVRGSMYVTDDAALPLSVHCPVYPVTRGTLACVPLVGGETVGSVHLYWRAPNALPLEARAGVVRIAQHAALAINNRRLLTALQGQANTDPRTGLLNTRGFDDALETALAGRQADESVAVLMLDIDHFKDFNDRYGHPAGDQALRAFADVLRSCLRDGDVAGRYGGEEFTVLLTGVDDNAARSVAERIRTRTESTLIPLAPGVSDRVTVSIGIAVAPDQGQERVGLLRLADDALYRAKDSGRNRVAVSGELEPLAAA